VRVTDSVLAPQQPDRPALRDRFFADAGRWSLGLVRGRRWRLSIGPVDVLRFGEPQARPAGWSWPIEGGLLARAPGGTLTIEWSAGRLSAHVDGYRPLLPDFIYRLFQLPFHHLTTRLFLLRLRGVSPPPGRPPARKRRLLATALDIGSCLALSRGRPRRALLVTAAYHVAFWGLLGQTPGELAAGIRLAALDGSKPTPAQAAVRLLAGDSLAATAMVEAWEG
jgi:RDD family